MLRSNSPRVEGRVSIIAATPSPRADSRAAMSVLPFRSEGMVTTSKPHMAAGARVVPVAGAGAEGVDAGVDAVFEAAAPQEIAHALVLRQLGQVEVPAKVARVGERRRR